MKYLVCFLTLVGLQSASATTPDPFGIGSSCWPLVKKVAAVAASPVDDPPPGEDLLKFYKLGRIQYIREIETGKYPSHVARLNFSDAGEPAWALVELMGEGTCLILRLNLAQP